MKSAAPASSVGDYLDAARARLVGIRGPGEVSWRELVDRSLGPTYSRGDLTNLARAVQLLVNLLEGDGRFADAVREIDNALGYARHDPGATASLNALKAAMLAGRGDPEGAILLSSESAAAARAHLEDDALLQALVLCKAARLQALKAPGPSFDRLFAEVVAAGRPLDQLFLLSWLVPALAARGEVDEARPRIRAMAAVALAESAVFRGADVVVFRYWANAIAAPAHELPEFEGRQKVNALAVFRLRALKVWRALILRERPAVPAALAALDLACGRLGADAGDAGNWVVLASAWFGEGVESIPVPPQRPPTLANLASRLAGAYVAALAGTPLEAKHWFAEVGRLRTAGIRSSLELPVSVDRIYGLLALRSGKAASARRYMEDAAEWATAAGLEAEACLATIQAGELGEKLRANGEPGSPVRQRIAAAAARLVELGIEPIPYRFAIHEAWDAAALRTRSAMLTPREVEVLQHLAGGETYKETAEALGIAWSTVRTVAHRVHGKLGVDRRIDAIRVARKMSLIE